MCVKLTLWPEGGARVKVMVSIHHPENRNVFSRFYRNPSILIYKWTFSPLARKYEIVVYKLAISTFLSVTESAGLRAVIVLFHFISLV